MIRILIFLASWGTCFACIDCAGADSRPNILLIVADDLGFSDLGCYGGEIKTPNLDRMAADGMRFTQFYNCAVCNLTRAALMTGLNPRFGKGGLLRTNMVTLPEVLSSGGYTTSMSGKWHLGGEPTRPIDRGFQEFYGVMIGAVNYFDPSLPDPPGLKHAGPTNPFVHNSRPIQSVQKDYYATDAFADHAIEQIRRQSKGDQPWFLHLAFTAPHYPLQALPEDINKYRGRYDEGYEILRQKRYQRLVDLNIISKDWKLPDVDSKQGEWRYDLSPKPWNSVTDIDWESAKMEVYAAMVDRLDQAIGRVLSTLKECDVEGNTLVIFFSDNGACASESSAAAYRTYRSGVAAGGKETYILGGSGWACAQSSPFRRYKTWTYEGGISTPMIVRWPDYIPAGSRTDAVSHVIDWMPTLLDFTHTKYPRDYRSESIIPFEGESLSNVLHDARPIENRELGWSLYGSRAYRSGKWKLVWGVTSKRWELYDMDTDRTETTDVAIDHPEKVEKLAKAWRIWSDRSELP